MATASSNPNAQVLLRMREERFSSPVTLASASQSQVRACLQCSDFPSQVRACLQCNDFPSAYYYQELEGKMKTITDVVQAAADGILNEGTALGKGDEAKRLAAELLLVKDLGRSNEAERLPFISSEICKTCVCLYTKNSFLFKRLNEILRDLEVVTPEQVKILGPFSWLLHHSLQLPLQLTVVDTVYRGLKLTDDQRQKFMEKEMTFTSFTSTTTNMHAAEMFSGNTLLIIDLKVIEWTTRSRVRCAVNISKLSAFPDEDEYLIWPTTIFDFVNYECVSQDKHIIYLRVAAKNC